MYYKQYRSIDYVFVIIHHSFISHYFVVCCYIYFTLSFGKDCVFFFFFLVCKMPELLGFLAGIFGLQGQPRPNRALMKNIIKNHLGLSGQTELQAKLFGSFFFMLFRVGSKPGLKLQPICASIVEQANNRDRFIKIECLFLN